MKTYKNKTVKTVNQIYCDSCGKNCTITEPVEDHEYAELNATWGYFSNQDGTQYDIHLCEICFMEVINFIKKKRKSVLDCFDYPYDHDPLNGKSYL